MRHRDRSDLLPNLSLLVPEKVAGLINGGVCMSIAGPATTFVRNRRESDGQICTANTLQSCGQKTITKVSRGGGDEWIGVGSRRTFA